MSRCACIQDITGGDQKLKLELNLNEICMSQFPPTFVPAPIQSVSNQIWPWCLYNHQVKLGLLGYIRT